MITITNKSVQSDYQSIFGLGVGDVFKFDRTIEYETVCIRLAKYKPVNVTAYTVEYVRPGHQLFTFYQENTVVITSITIT